MNITHPDDAEALEEFYNETQSLISLAQCDEENAPIAFALGLDIPTLTAWYNNIHQN